MELVYTTPAREAVGYLDYYGFDLSIGDSGNEMEVTLHGAQRTELDKGSVVFSPGAEYGGIVQSVTSALATDGQRYVKYGGPTWSGRLAQKVVVPPSGKEHYRMEGEANAAIGALLSYLGLSGLFSASSEDSGVTLATDLDRFADGWNSLRKALSQSDARLSMGYDHETKSVVVQAVKREAHGGEYSSDSSPISVTTAKAVNHLVCAGTGEGTARIVVHLYIQADGSIGETPYYTGLDMIDSLYENTGAERDKLVEEGRKKLKELQAVNVVSISVDEAKEDLYPLDDVILGVDPVTGTSASSTIAKKVVSVDSDGFETYRYEAAEVGSTVSSSYTATSGGSSGGSGTTYKFGAGLTVSGNEVSADVTTDKLNAVGARATAAETAASNASAEAAAALADSQTRVATVAGASPIAATRTSNAVTVSHETSGVTAGSYGPAADATPAWGDQVSVGARASVDAQGHVTGMAGRKLTIPSAAATKSKAGLMSASDKKALDAASATYVKKAGDIMTGSLTVASNSADQKYFRSAYLADDGSEQVVGYFAAREGRVSVSTKFRGDDDAMTYPNSMVLNQDSTTFGKPVQVNSGGTGATTAANARANLLSNLSASMVAVDDTTPLLRTNLGNGGVIQYLKGLAVWEYVSGKIKSLIKPADIGAASEAHTHDAGDVTGILPIAHGGTGNATGKAASAGRLSTARTIKIAGAVNGSAKFDGSGDVTITVVGDTASAGFLAAHPVGSIFATSVQADPGVTYGGKWQELKSADSFKYVRLE